MIIQISRHRLAFSLLARSALAALGLSALPAAARAQSAPPRVWVSVTGSDVAGCYAATAPCRTFQYAENLIAPGGEIDVAMPGGYGAVTITKAVTINAGDGGPTTIGASVATPNAITIDAGVSDAVFIKGLSIDGAGVAGNGIQFNSGGALTVRNCTIRNFGSASSQFGPGAGFFFSPPQ